GVQTCALPIYLSADHIVGDIDDDGGSVGVESPLEQEHRRRRHDDALPADELRPLELGDDVGLLLDLAEGRSTRATRVDDRSIAEAPILALVNVADRH